MACTPTIVGCCCIQNPCCPGKTIPSQLLAVVSGTGGPCDGNYTLTYNGSGGWDIFVVVGDCPDEQVTILVECVERDGGCVWILHIEGDEVGDFSLVNCDPLHLQLVGFSQFVNCGCPDAPTIDIFEL